MLGACDGCEVLFAGRSGNAATLYNPGAGVNLDQHKAENVSAGFRVEPHFSAPTSAFPGRAIFKKSA
jgi:hypothetical protein